MFNYFGRPLRLNKSMYGMTNYGKLFSGDINNWLIYVAGFKQSQYQMSIYYNYASEISRLIMLSYVDDFIYWYKYEDLAKWFVDTILKMVHVNFLGYSHWFMSSSISKLKNCSISAEQARHVTAAMSKYLDTDTIKANLK